MTFYLILSGTVKYGEVECSCQIRMKQFSEEMAFFDNQPRSADVITSTETTCVLLTSWDLMGVVLTNPKIAQRIIGELTSRLRETNKSLGE